MQLPLEVLTEDGYRFQLNVEGTHYITGDMSFPVDDVTFDESSNPMRGWFGDKETGVGFNVTIPMPEDKVMFHWERIPGQLLRDEKYFSLSSDGSYESLDDCLLFSEVLEALNQDKTDSLVSGVFEDGSRLKVLSWIVPLDNYAQHLCLSAVVSFPYTAVQVVGAREYFYIQRQDNEGRWQTVSTWTSLDDAIASVLSWRLSEKVTDKIFAHQIEKNGTARGHVHWLVKADNQECSFQYRSNRECFNFLLRELQVMAKVSQMPDELEPNSSWFVLLGDEIDKLITIVIKFISETESWKSPFFDDPNQMLAHAKEQIEKELGEEIGKEFDE